MLVQQIRSEISESFPSDLQNVKLNIDLINQICNAVENISGRKKINKLEMFMKIHRACFGQLDTKDQEYVTNII
jgi:hypothetical protein